MASRIKKCGALVCRALLGIIQSSNGNFNYITIGLLFLSLAVYALIFSWQFAILLIVAVAFHESGHVWAMKRFDMNTAGFFLIPLVGAGTFSTSNYTSQRSKSIVVMMGPIWGMGLALITWVAYLITGNQFLGMAAYWQAVMNLFNLLPVNPLDGGQLWRSVLTSFSKRAADVFSFVSILVLIAMFTYFKSPLFLVAVFLSSSDFWTNYKRPATNEIISLSRSEIAITIASYVILCSTLLVIVAFTTAVGANFGSLLAK